MFPCHGPFLERGIPCGGLETGAEKIKTEAERQMFGGWANAAYDTCYHQFCDTIENILQRRWQSMHRPLRTQWNSCNAP